MSDFNCIICNVSLCSLTSYRNHCSSQAHLKALTIHNQKTTKLASQIKSDEYNCKYCNKSYCNKGNLTRHKKSCVKLIELKDKYIKNIDKIIEKEIDFDIDNNKLEHNNIKLLSNSSVPNITINIQQNIQQNITNNTANVVNNIEIAPDEVFNSFWNQANIRPMGFEDLSGLETQEAADRIHSYGLNCFVEFINLVYQNKLNHNIALFNKREKLVKYVHKSGEVKIDSLPCVMSSVLMNLVDYLDTYLDRVDIEIKKQYLPIIKQLKELHSSEENPQLDKYNTHLYNRLLNITNSSLDKIKDFEHKINNELRDKLKELTLNIPRTDSRTEPDILSVQ